VVCLDNDRIKEKRNLMKKMGELPIPYAEIHASCLDDAKEMADDIVPLYKGYDKLTLFEDKKTYWLIPREIARMLIRCDKTTMISEDQLPKEALPIMQDLERKKRIKKFGKYYFDLEETTRNLLCKYAMDRSNAQ
jgi:hypothetical protein